jgi:hypothetical protein
MRQITNTVPKAGQIWKFHHLDGSISVWQLVYQLNESPDQWQAKLLDSIGESGYWQQRVNDLIDIALDRPDWQFYETFICSCGKSAGYDDYLCKDCI